MTTREFLNDVISVCALFTDQPADCVNIEELSTKASELLSALDARNEKRKTTDSKEKREARERVQTVLNFLCDHQGEPFTRDDIASATGLSVGQVTAACQPIVADGTIIRAETKVGKARKVAYTYPVEE